MWLHDVLISRGESIVVDNGINAGDGFQWLEQIQLKVVVERHSTYAVSTLHGVVL